MCGKRRRFCWKRRRSHDLDRESFVAIDVVCDPGLDADADAQKESGCGAVLDLAGGVDQVFGSSFGAGGAGRQIGGRAAPVVAMQSAVPMVMEQIGQPFAGRAVSPANVSPAALPLAGILLTIWGFGFVGIAYTWWRKWRRVRAEVRTGSVLHLELSIPVV